MAAAAQPSSSIFGTSASIAMGYLTASDKHDDDVTEPGFDETTTFSVVAEKKSGHEHKGVEGCDVEKEAMGMKASGVPLEDAVYGEDVLNENGIFSRVDNVLTQDGFANEGGLGGKIQSLGGKIQSLGGKSQSLEGKSQSLGDESQILGDESQILGGESQILGGESQILGGDESADDDESDDDDASAEDVVVYLQRQFMMMQTTISSLQDQLGELRGDVRAIMHGAPFAVHGHVVPVSTRMSYHSEEVNEAHFSRSTTVKDLEKQFENAEPAPDTLVSFM